MIESFFFDFDGTLQGFENHSISESTQEALKILKQKNKNIYIATGRSLSDLPEHVFRFNFDGFINNNGSMCSNSNKEVFFIECIDKADIEALLEYDLENPTFFSFMTVDKNNPFVINRINDNITRSFNYFGSKVPKVKNLRDLPKDNIMQMNLFVDEKEEKFLMENVLKNSVATRWMEYFADINPKDVNKMKGIERMAIQYNLDLSKTMSFGDGGNDIEMIKGCKIGVAMGNANDNVKEIADYVTSSVDRDGIWNALKEYDLI